MKTPEYALEAAIAVWVKDNQDLVRCAIRLGAETTSLGLVDAETNSFMQIVLDAHYAMNDAGEDKDYEKVEQILNDMLKQYHEETESPLLEIKNIIDTYKGEIGIKATNDDEVVQPVNSVNTRYDLALLHPENWVVTKSDGINGQSWLSSWLKNFQVRENKAASLLYYAQKIAVEYLGLRLLVHTDSVEPETDLTAEVLRDKAMNLALVRPVIHATKFEIIR